MCGFRLGVDDGLPEPRLDAEGPRRCGTPAVVRGDVRHLRFFGEGGVEALRVADSAARRLMRQINKPEARHKAHTLHYTARMFNPLLKRFILPREKRPRTTPTPAPPPAPPPASPTCLLTLTR